MSEHYIGRAAEAAARARHNRIHNPMKKTAKKKTAAKKVPSKQARAFSQALETFKKPESPIKLQHAEHLLVRKIGQVIKEPADSFVDLPNSDPVPEHAENWESVPNYGPSTEVDEEAMAREVLFGEMPVSDAHAAAVEASPPNLGHIVPQTTPDAPQTPLHDEKLGQNLKPSETTDDQLDPEQLANNIELLIDSLNFIHDRGWLRKMQEKDIQIVKARIKCGRKIISQLRN
jgi:hypothetical protein